MRSRAFARPLGILLATGRRRILHPLVWALALFVATVPLAARADDDLPGRVGRIADFSGQLFLSTQDRAAEWAPIGVNYPVTSGDNLFVSGEGRTEIDYGGGQLRLAGDTSLHVSRLDDRQLALFIAQGRLILRVRVLDAGDAVLVDTPNAQVTLTRPGLYRIDVVADRQATTVSVREGEALVALASGVQQMLPGQMLTVTGPDPVYADVRNGFGLDGFDTWGADRDRRYERGLSSTYVSREMVGYAELDEYGVWENAPTYGPVWYPSAVAVDWTPYRYGYWTDVGGWGLTWVDAAPWGYAPSHYGRWVRIGGRWGWCPGAFVARPRWAPALVAWYGGGSWGQPARAGGPVYGWVPLGWGDTYHPSWRNCSNDCWARYNRTYGVNVAARPLAPPARYSNAGVPGAMTAVAAPALAARKPVPANMVALPGSAATSAPVLAMPPAVAPGSGRISGYRPGDRGTPAPASSARTWGRRDAAVPVPSPARSAVAAPEARRGAPVALTPGTGGTIVATPPVQQTPSAPQSSTRAGSPSAGGPAAGRAPGVSPSTSGMPLSPPRPMPAPALGQPQPPAVSVAPVAVPTAPARPMPAPSRGQPQPATAGAPVPAGTLAAPAAPPHVPQSAPAKATDAGSAAGGKAVDKSAVAPATLAK